MLLLFILLPTNCVLGPKSDINNNSEELSKINKKIVVDNHGVMNYQEVGYASWYGEGDGFNLRKTASGEIFNKKYLSAAHRTLPLASTIKVTNLDNQKSIVLKVNDRGPYVDDRILDLSAAAAEVLGMKSQGLAKVKVECISCKVSNITVINEK